MIYRFLHSMVPEYLFEQFVPRTSRPSRYSLRSASIVINLMLPQSNYPLTELVLSAVLVPQFGIVSIRNVSETRHYFMMF